MSVGKAGRICPICGFFPLTEKRKTDKYGQMSTTYLCIRCDFTEEQYAPTGLSF